MRRTAVAVVSLHLALVLATHWILFVQFREELPGDYHAALAAAFAVKTGSLLALEAVAVIFTGLGTIAVLTAFRSRRTAERIAMLLLLSYIPIGLYTAGVLIAVAMGWNVDTLLFAGPGASPADVAATIGGALPVIMEPLSSGRHAANAIGVLVFAALLRRREYAPTNGAVGAAALAALILTAAAVLAREL